MKLYNFTSKSEYEGECFPKSCRTEDTLFLLCRTHEVPGLRDVFDFDESTVNNCTDLDESIRFTSFGSYDFVSMTHAELTEDRLLVREINLYVSAEYLVLVLPEHESPCLLSMEKTLETAAKASEERGGKVCSLYFLTLHCLLSDFSDTLEHLEDRMQALSEEIVAKVNEEQFGHINQFRNMAYTLKKQLRALSYLGEQILLDENKLIPKGQIPFFRNISTRFKKHYDFAESLYGLGSEMLYTYDSKLTMKTNETVNKLTSLTIFFGPLTLITGIYGMNFTHMPELRWPLGYPLALGMMAAVSLVVYLVLKRMKR